MKLATGYFRKPCRTGFELGRICLLRINLVRWCGDSCRASKLLSSKGFDTYMVVHRGVRPIVHLPRPARISSVSKHSAVHQRINRPISSFPYLGAGS